MTIDGEASAGFDPLEIKPVTSPPEDFDAFWNEKKARLAAIPMNLRLALFQSTHPDVKVYDLQADCLGVPVSGYLAHPVDSRPGSLPAILTLHGSGVTDSDVGQAICWANEGMLALDINAHGLPNGRPEQFYTSLKDGELKDYPFKGCASRDDYYFLRMYLRLIRAIDVLTSQPLWDGKVLVVYGASQGGLQSIVAAGLDKRVSLVVAGVPAMCDPTGFTVGRMDGTFFVVSRGLKPDGSLKPDVMNASRYYAAANFAARVKVPSQFTVGFIDHSCPPALVYSAYNMITSQKQIHNGPTSGHALTAESRGAMRKAILDHRKNQAALQ